MASVTAMSEMLIGFDAIMEIVETALYSAYIAGTIPLSVILIGPSGGGKSKVIMQYSGSTGCHLTNDITSSGLQQLLERDYEGKIRTLVIPDFNVVLSHRSSTLQLTIANLLSVTSEGTVRIDDGREKKETKHVPIGIITAMTRELYTHVAKKWAILGFNRRFLPIYFEYSMETRKRVQQSITAGSATLLQLAPRMMHANGVMRDVEVGTNYALEIQSLSDELSNNIGYIPMRMRQPSKDKEKSFFIGKQLEFTPHLALRSMARAHALKSGRDNVTAEDITFITHLLDFTRFDRPGRI